MIELITDRYVYLFVVTLLSIGLFTVIVERHLVKKLVGLIVFQTGIFIFFIEGSVAKGADVPVIDPEVGTDPQAYANPLPHLLILTALVVGVAVVGVALSLMVTIQSAYGTLDDVLISSPLPPDPPSTDTGDAPGSTADEGDDEAADRIDPTSEEGAG